MELGAPDADALFFRWIKRKARRIARAVKARVKRVVKRVIKRVKRVVKRVRARVKRVVKRVFTRVKRVAKAVKARAKRLGRVVRSAVKRVVGKLTGWAGRAKSWVRAQVLHIKNLMKRPKGRPKLISEKDADRFLQPGDILVQFTNKRISMTQRLIQWLQGGIKVVSGLFSKTIRSGSLKGFHDAVYVGRGQIAEASGSSTATSTSALAPSQTGSLR